MAEIRAHPDRPSGLVSVIINPGSKQTRSLYHSHYPQLVGPSNGRPVYDSMQKSTNAFIKVNDLYTIVSVSREGTENKPGYE